MLGELLLPDRFEIKLRAALELHLGAAARDAGFLPSVEELRTTLQAAFWSSLIPDEGQNPRAIVNLRSPTSGPCTMAFAEPLPLSASTLAKLTTATDLSASSVCVGRAAAGLVILGIDTHLAASATIRMEIRGPARVAIKAADTTVGWLNGSDAELTDAGFDGKHLFFPVAQSGTHDDRLREARFLDIARAMLAHTRGGAVLVLAPGQSISPELCSDLELHYQLSTPFRGPRDADSAETATSAAITSAERGLSVKGYVMSVQANQISREQAIASLARTTAVDGAALVSSEGSLLAFGCKIRLSSAPRVTVRRPTSASSSSVSLAEFGGTRHQSAARFVGKHAGTRAIVSSQDGGLSVLSHAGVDQVDCLEQLEWML